jgi:hypothetical protein
MKLRTVGWAVAAVWATGMTVAMARIAGTLDSLASRPVPVAAPQAPSGPSEVAISLRADPTAGAAPGAPAPTGAEAPVEPASPEEEAAEERARTVLAEMVAQGAVDDQSIDALRHAITAMRPADRIDVMAAFATAASRGEINVAPDDFRRAFP